MGLLQKGKWVDQWYDTKTSGGEFRRQDSRFRSWISADGSIDKGIDAKVDIDTDSTAAEKDEAETGQGFKAEKGRYHLYVSLACPWAHRTLIFRKLKKLEDYIDVTVVDSLMKDRGWTLNDPLYGFDYLYQLYLKADSRYEGRVTVPVLWDKKTETIVSNESSEIIRMLNSAFNHLTGNSADYYPADMREDIEEVNDRVYDTINNGVYRAGFATSQQAYEKAFTELFASLDWAEQRLSQQRYLLGDKITEADWRLFTTLIRFDAVYVGHFKCNLKRIADYPNISAYVRELYQVEGVAETVDFGHIKHHYYASHDSINPTGIVPLGPEQNFMLPHNRDRQYIRAA